MINKLYRFPKWKRNENNANIAGFGISVRGKQVAVYTPWFGFHNIGPEGWSFIGFIANKFRSQGDRLYLYNDHKRYSDETCVTIKDEQRSELLPDTSFRKTSDGSNELVIPGEFTPILAQERLAEDGLYVGREFHPANITYNPDSGTFST